MPVYKELLLRIFGVSQIDLIGSCCDAVVLAIYVAIAGLTIVHHEPWADEAQSWLLARDLSWLQLIFSELRYEGHPGLWHSILWLAIHWFHASYAALGWIGLACATLGMAVVVFLAPFPRPLRWLIAFSFFFLYQYSAIARSYNLLPLFTFLGAEFYRRTQRYLFPFTAAIMLLANVSLHGTMISMALAASYGWNARQNWSALNQEQSRRYLIALFSLGLMLAFLVIVLWPPHGTVAFSDASRFTLATHLLRSAGTIGLAFTTVIPLSFVIFFVVYIWCSKRNVRFVYLAPLVANALLFGFIRGAKQHVGITMIATIAALWIGWPREAEVRSYPPSRRHWHYAWVAALCVLFAYQINWSYFAIRNDWKYPYSGAPEAAEYLKSVGAQHKEVDGFNYSSVALLPYFRTNIFANWPNSNRASYFHNSVEFRQRVMLGPDMHLQAEYVVLGDLGFDDYGRLKAQMQLLQDAGYSLVHVADGTGFFTTPELSENQVYRIFRRNVPVRLHDRPPR